MEPLDAARVDQVLLRGAGAIELSPAGIRHPRSVRLGGRCTSPYASVTHVVLEARGLRLATEHGTFLFRRRAFRDARGPEILAEAIHRRIAEEPGGAAQHARMVELDRRMQARGRAWVGAVLAACSVAAFVLQLAVPEFHYLGFFSHALVALGEGWRLVSANLLHGSPIHLALNVACLLAFGGLLERSVGTAVTVLVTAVAGVGAMLGCFVAGYEQALGASGIVYGLIGALLWLEFNAPQELPAIWRLPRRIFVLVLVAETLALWWIPQVAHAAHLGGFVAGWLTCAFASRPLPSSAPRGRLRAGLAAGAVGIALYALGVQATAVWSPDPRAIARRAEALLSLSEVSPTFLNNEAWRIAVAAAPAPADLHVASRLAERAVRETAGLEPTILDTLAEVYFASGRREEALAAIDEAIALAPGEHYYREQRRRFTGERPAGDRPADPSPQPGGDGGQKIPPSPDAIRV